MPCDEQARHVDVVCFTTSDADRPVLPVDHHDNESDADRGVQPVALEAGAENDGEDGYSNSSDENNILNNSGALEHLHTDQLETNNAVQPDESHGMDIDAASAVQAARCAPIADINNEELCAAILGQNFGRVF